MQGKIFVKKLGVGVMEIAEFINKEKMNYCESKCKLFSYCEGKNAELLVSDIDDHGHHITYKCKWSKSPPPKIYFNVFIPNNHEIFFPRTESHENHRMQ